MRHLLTLFEITQPELATILSVGDQIKRLLASGRRPPWLAQRVLAMLFEKPSLRTRVSFEAGIIQLGGGAMFLGQDVGWQSRESTDDFVRVLAQYADFVVCRAKSHSSVVELAKHDCVPIINGLTDMAHPCQALADLMTMQEVVGSLKDRQLTFVGDGNNVARSLALACAMVNMRFRLLGPSGYSMDEKWIAQIAQRYPHADIVQSSDPRVALKGTDFVYTDVWTSMGQEQESAIRRAAFVGYQLNANLMRFAPHHARVLHCLPARRGEEITDEVIDSPQSIVVEQAGNRMHAQKGLLVWMSIQHRWVEPQALTNEGIQLETTVPR